MQYILMLHAPEAGWAAMTQSQQQQAMAAFYAYTEALTKASARSVNRLQPSSTTTTVRVCERPIGGPERALRRYEGTDRRVLHH
jgi:hypothetical protein